MIVLKAFAAEYGYPYRALRYFLEKKLTKGEHYFIQGRNTVISEATARIMHKRFKRRTEFPISYKRILSEFEFSLKAIKRFLVEERDYIQVGNYYYFSRKAYAKIISKAGGFDTSDDYTSPIGVTEARSFAEMSEREKHRWAENIGLTKEARDLIFN
jgi:hypothetical protein